jgi:hypothetical protein
MQEQIEETIQPLREALKKHMEEALNQAFDQKEK